MYIKILISLFVEETLVMWDRQSTLQSAILSEPRHQISNNVVCSTRKGSDQPAHMCSLIRAFC